MKDTAFTPLNKVNLMKKYLYILAAFMFLNTTHSQLLYDESFEGFTLGNLGTDPSGVIPGQGGWLTHGRSSRSFSITADPGPRSKVLTLACTDIIIRHTNLSKATKTNLNNFIDQRIPGSNVIKIDIDYFTREEHSEIYKVYPRNLITLKSRSSSVPLIGWYIRVDGQAHATFDKGNGSDAQLQIDNGPRLSPNPLPYNTWITFTDI